MHEGSRDYTFFDTHSGQYRYLRAPFGLKTSGSQFIALINDLLRKKLYKDVLVYLNDIVYLSEEFEDHLKILQWILNKLLKSKLKLKAPKYKFTCNKIIRPHCIRGWGLLISTKFPCNFRLCPT